MKGELKGPIFHISEFQITQWYLEESQEPILNNFNNFS